MSWPWNVLGLPDGADLAAVKHAYAERLKTTHPEEDPEGFQALHGAYQAACRYARRSGEEAAPPPVQDPYPHAAPYTPPPPASSVRPSERAAVKPHIPRWRVVGLVCILIFGVLLVSSVKLMSRLKPNPHDAHTAAASAAPSSAPTPSPTPRPASATHLRDYLKEDLGVALSPITSTLEDGRYEFSLEGDPELRFHASPDGKRDPAAGKPGYETDYTDALLYRALSAFAEEWDLSLFLDPEQTNEFGMKADETVFPSVYHLAIPTTGAEEALAALGELLAAFPGTYSEALPPPQATLYVGRGDLVVSQCSFQAGGTFDTEQALYVYENDFASAFARYVLEESGAAVEDAGPDHALIPYGLVEVRGEPYFRFDAVENESSDTAVYQYFVSADGNYIECVPIPWPEKLVPQSSGVPQAFSYYLTSDLVDLPGRITVEVQRYFDWSKLS